VYERVCATCHGHNLKTAGVAAQDLREFPIEDSARFIRSVTQGAGDMPPFAKVLSEAEIVSIFDYVRAMRAAEQ
jgi:mono/diheme cytochrome c family protein